MPARASPVPKPSTPAKARSPSPLQHTANQPEKSIDQLVAAAVVAAADPTSRQTSLAPQSREPTPAVETPAAHSDADDEEEDESDPAQTIDLETFQQILELDEDDTHDFSKGMAWAYFSQATSTFDEMDTAYSKKDLGKLSSLGHFLKGSSAALGVTKVQAACEKIQHYGQLRDEETGTDLTDATALQKIEPLLSRVKTEYAIAESWLKKWYEEHCAPEEEGD